MLAIVNHLWYKGDWKSPTEVNVTRTCNPENKEAMKKFEEHVTMMYAEPAEDGEFEDITKEILEELTRTLMKKSKLNLTIIVDSKL